MPLNLSLLNTFDARYTGNRPLEAQASNLLASYSMNFADGAGLGQASRFWSDRRVLATGVGESLDLNGVLIDGLGASVTFTAIKGILLKAADANTTILTVGNIANGLATIFGIATQSFPMQPGELLIKATPSAAGHVVTPATADLLRIVNAAGASATYDVAIWGV